jgi:hypothetical protein
MFTYRCLFCDGRYHTSQRMRSCTICGQMMATGWFCKDDSPNLPKEQPNPLPSSHTRLSELKAA